MPVISGSDSRSGYLNLPPRVQLRERDSATGSYPTMARTGDPDFSGNKPVKFDDSRTVIFSDNVTVSYPTLLQPTGLGLKYISGSLATPNSGSDILATGTVRKGIADQFAFFDNSESIGPFKEHQRVLPNSGAFYLTGTDPNVLPGFSSRLSSKTIIKIPMTVLTGSSVFWSTGSVPNALGTDQGVNSGLSYFNFATGKWDVVGVDATTTTGSAVDYLNPSLSVRSGSLLCVQSDTVNAKTPLIPSDYKFNYQSIIGKPNSTFGFPNDAKFDASSQQRVTLSDYISNDFLIEKTLFFWSGSINLFGFGPTSAIAPHRTAFGIMAVHPSSSVNQLSFDSTVGGIASQTVWDASVGFSPTNQHKDIVTYGRIQLVKTTEASYLVDKQRVELDIIRDTITAGVTGTFTLPTTAIQTGVIPSSSLAYNLLPARRSSGDSYQFTRFGGTRDGLDISNSTTGKSTRPFVGQRIVSTVNGTFDGVSVDLAINDPDATNLVAPYLVTPKDSLVMYAVNQPVLSESAFAVETEADFASKYRWNFAPGESYVLLIGSQIRDGKEFHDTSNQPLNSDAIHEALHFDNPTVDQFQVEALTSYSGTYIDDIVSGDFTAGTRGVVGSPAAGTQGLTGSLLRGVRTVDRAERYYDTVLPNIIDTHVIDGFGTTQAITAGGVGIGIADGSKPTAGIGSSVNTRWGASYPFEPRFTSIPRKPAGNPLYSESESKTLAGIQIFVSKTDGSSFGGGLVSAANPLNPPTTGEFLKYWFGTGDGHVDDSAAQGPFISNGNFPNIDLNAVTSNEFFITSIRGFKYGVKNALPEFSSLVTRYDRYGQFRDMLEQRPDSRFSTGEAITEPPIVIRFIDSTTRRPVPASLTSSSNRSEFATSSLPYFDGVARN